MIMVNYSREVKGQTTTIRRFYISSLRASAQDMAACIRAPWQIENNLHWVMDVTFSQGHHCIRTGTPAANFATIEHAASNLLRRAPGKKSLPTKRHSVAWADNYLEKIITA